MVPPAVQTELEAGLKIKVGVPDVARLSWVEVRAVESQALIPALILDDLLARRIAALNSLTYTGTVGVLIKAKQGGHLGAIRPVIEGLRTSGLWLSDEPVATVLAHAGESPDTH